MLPTDPKERKDTPIYSGVLKYFPLALAEVARVSKAGNDQHNPGQPLHWAKDKSTDHHDCIVRHLVDAGTLDSDGQRHSAKVAWRALAALEVELEVELEGGQAFVPVQVFDYVKFSVHCDSGHNCIWYGCTCNVIANNTMCSCHHPEHNNV